ncbi:flavin-containing monooxygenase [Mycolicibacterium sediminis]|uniref:Monooxygenase n=1 Tax=Mycolicibacterium sediminis TaxID=1286180 RepID=A0A7I7QRQ5_9MYCO|nr:NAD(P)-binding domain-containing protein [Mycolicibacterium sediminis]BBY29063.1 monooxygenase [Mycolicibacterium sediminis]
MARDVAVIGAGPGGLVAARWLAAQGFEPTIFERSPVLGGQWAGIAGRSGVWPTMHTNTSSVLTAFSDLDHDGPAVHPSNRDVLTYLERYARTFALTERIRFDCPVHRVGRDGTGWRIDHAGGTDHVERVVVASGRFQSPTRPTIPGLASFTGRAGVTSTFDYRGADPFRGARVLVVGGAISALEIASELAVLGAERVVVTQRRQRYVLPKFAAGVPSDHRMFTRYGVLAGETLPPAEVDAQVLRIVLEAGGSPDQYGAPTPDPSPSVAGVTLCQQYLPLVAEGRIAVRPWPTSVSGRSVRFSDGRSEDFDAILFGTGFEATLPFLSEDVREVLGADGEHLDVDRYTFHPDLPGLAFAGMWDQSGGYFVPLELQARWIAYAWGGAVRAPDVGEQRAAVATCRARRGTPQKTRMNAAALGFARAAGVEPHLERWPDLRRALLFGPLAPSQFRLEGPDALPGAAERFARDASTFGCITTGDFTDLERRHLEAIGAPAPA